MHRALSLVGSRLLTTHHSLLAVSDLQSRLEAAVGDTYRIEKELGGGGMSFVFLAEEVALGRRVVIKVLPPDMSAGVNKERFQREIKLAASLQHPHVVSLLTAGTADGDLLYYVMPYIEGESLRAKLDREVELPVGEALKILREVVDALAYAHRHEVVHRDIKPDNVLLSEGHAVVTDFGVAKAVSASSGGPTSGLTSLGVALGTPAYMSPEQAAADPHVDHRADIYSLGTMAYEMLAGRTPFTGNTAQQLLAAHVSQAVEPVTQHRATVPPALADVIMRCLEKKPADRWQTADELRAQLEIVATPQTGGVTPTGTQPVSAVSTADVEAKHHPVRVAALFGVAAATTLAVVYGIMIALGLPNWVFLAAVVLLAIGLPIMLVTSQHEKQRAVAMTTGLQTTTPVGLKKHLTWSKAIGGGGLAFAGLVVFAGGFMVTRAAGIGPAATLVSSGVLGERDLLILAEFDNRTSDSTLGTTVTELLRISLSESPVLRLADPPRIAESLERMQLDPDTRVDESVALEIAERESIKAAIVGEIAPLGSGYVIGSRLISAAGEVLVAQQASANDASGIIEAVDKLSAKMRERIGESLKSIRRELPLELVTTGSLEALRLYTQASQAEIAGDPDRAVALLDEAISVDSTFAMAYRKMGAILGNTFQQRAREIEALTKAYELRDRLTPLERGYAVAQYHTDVTGDLDQALAAYRTILDKFPDDDRALNNSGVLYGQLGDRERALEFYERGLDADSTWAPRYYNIAFTQMLLGRYDEARATIDVAEQRFPGQPRNHQFRGLLAYRLNEYDEAIQHYEILRASQSGNPFWQGQAAEVLGRIAQTRGRYRDGDRYLSEAISAARERDVPGSIMGIQINTELSRMMATGDAEQPRARLDREIPDEALEVLPAADRPYGGLIVFHALAGVPERARSLLVAMERSGIPGFGRDFQRDYDRSAGFVQLAEGDVERGLASMRRGVEGWSFEPGVLSFMARAHDAAGNADSARIYWERYLERRWAIPQMDAGTRHVAYRRLGELYEAQGDNTKAVEYYNQFVDLWKDADPELQPQVTEIRNRIARLVGETR